MINKVTSQTVKHVIKICHGFITYHKANKFTHYWMIFLCSINIYNNILITYELFDFFWNMFNTKTIKHVTLASFLANMVIQWVEYHHFHQDLLYMPPYFIWVNILLNKTIKSRSILIISLCFKMIWKMRLHQKFYIFILNYRICKSSTSGVLNCCFWTLWWKHLSPL